MFVLTTPYHTPMPPTATTMQIPAAVVRWRNALCGAVGTGGNTANFANQCRLTETTVLVMRQCLADLPEMMYTIKRYLVPTVTEQAAVLQVKRPTIYAWCDGDQPPRDGNMVRIEQVYQLALNARRILGETPPKELQRLISRTRLGSLLLEQDLVPEAVTQQLIEIRQARDQDLQAQVTIKPSIKALTASLGRSSDRSSAREEDIDRITGRNSRSDRE